MLSEALPVDAQRFTECAFWMAFWGQVSADKKLKRLNAWVHREYMRLFERCFAEHWPEWSSWPKAVREQVLRSVVTFINGLTASAVTSPARLAGAQADRATRLQLTLLRRWANAEPRARPASGGVIAMDFSLSDEQQLIIKTTRDFVQQRTLSRMSRRSRRPACCATSCTTS